MKRDEKLTGYKGLILAVFKDGDPDDLLPLIEKNIADIDEALQKLDPRAQEIMAKRFGIHGFCKLTLRKTGESLDPKIKQERVRQIEMSSLRKLRHPARLGRKIFFYSALLQHVDFLTKENEQFVKEVDGLSEELKKTKAELEGREYFAYIDAETKRILDSSINEYEFSVRAYSCLVIAKVEKIRDLVVKTEQEIRATKGLGQGTFEELKDFLDSLGLKFGMSFH